MYLGQISDTQHVQRDVIEHKSSVSYPTVTRNEKKKRSFL